MPLMSTTIIFLTRVFPSSNQPNWLNFFSATLENSYAFPSRGRRLCFLAHPVWHTCLWSTFSFYKDFFREDCLFPHTHIALKNLIFLFTFQLKGYFSRYLTASNFLLHMNLTSYYKSDEFILLRIDKHVYYIYFKVKSLALFL